MSGCKIQIFLHIYIRIIFLVVCGSGPWIFSHLRLMLPINNLHDSPGGICECGGRTTTNGRETWGRNDRRAVDNTRAILQGGSIDVGSPPGRRGQESARRADVSEWKFVGVQTFPNDSRGKFLLITIAYVQNGETGQRLKKLLDVSRS